MDANNVYCNGYLQGQCIIYQMYMRMVIMQHTAALLQTLKMFIVVELAVRRVVLIMFMLLYIVTVMSPFITGQLTMQQMFIFGYQAAYRADIVNVQQLYCDGMSACESSSITNVCIIEANGTDALESSNITSGGSGNTMFVIVHGDIFSTSNTWIICQTGDTCVIDCKDNIANICDIINFGCNGICVFNTTAPPTTIPTYTPTYQVLHHLLLQVVLHRPHQVPFLLLHQQIRLVFYQV